MYKLMFLLGQEDGEAQVVKIPRNDLALAYVDAIRIIKCVLGVSVLDFLPIGNDQYIIWGQGKYQGFMRIKDVSTIASDAEFRQLSS